jgi:hypothetical protein
LSYDEASTLPVAVSTAYLGLYNIIPYGLDLQSFFSKKMGWPPTKEKPSSSVEAPAQSAKIVGSLGIAVAYDTISNPETSLAQAMAAVIPGGRVVTTNVGVIFEPQEGRLLSRVNATAIPHNVEPQSKLALRLPGGQINSGMFSSRSVTFNGRCGAEACLLSSPLGLNSSQVA